MKNLIAITISLFSIFGINAQTQNPISWVASYKSISATEGEISIVPKIEKGWHTYSQKVSADGPVATTFVFADSKQYSLVGKVEEVNVLEEFDKAFDAKIFVVTDKSVFKQKVKLLGTKPVNIVVNVEFMCCNDMMCLPPKKIDVTVKVP